MADRAQSVIIYCTSHFSMGPLSLSVWSADTAVVPELKGDSNGETGT
jgi:hypothetical protein